MKKQNGITLIALVITIIVLLILAGVSISAITGENGIVDKAKEAAEKTETAQKEEEDILKGYEDAMDELLDEGFPYGVLYSMENEEFNIVVYEDGAVEGFGIDGTDMILIEHVEAGQGIIDGNILKIGDEATFTIADDYSTLSNESVIYTKTSKVITQCAHRWEETDNSDYEGCYECSKCGVYSPTGY